MPSANAPSTRYARTVDDAYIAYQTIGTGPPDLLVIHGWFSHLEVYWEQPRFARFMRALSSIGRVIHFDKRGAGLSDRINRALDLDGRMEDARAVLDTVGSDRAILFGWGDGAALATLLAATYPERITALCLWQGGVRTAWAPDYPWGETEEEFESEQRRVPEIWGDPAHAEEFATIGDGGSFDADSLEWWVRWARFSVAPGDAMAFDRMWFETDVREVLPTIQVPSVIFHRVSVNPGEAQYVAERIPGARLVEVAGDSWLPWVGDPTDLVGAVRSFLGTVRDEEAVFDHVLATVLFTDIVGSTEKAAEIGDHAWRSLVERHHATVRTLLARFRGTEVDTAGDGFFATFDGPARAVRCAQAIVDAVKPLGIEVRMGLHTGEVETIDGKVGGISVAIGARVGALARTSEIMVSQTVKDLTAGSGLTFGDAGEHELKGIPDRWRLYRVVDG